MGSLDRQVSITPFHGAHIDLVDRWSNHCYSTESERVEIRNEALSNTRMSFFNKEPGRIICLIWGQENVLT